ncbi:type I methionyl aminopeptidase [Candidatus Peribacteria bacterium]|nr:MAG: type I methionyl aminopeptidase [Candidatus Peribacteria bacterium]
MSGIQVFTESEITSFRKGGKILRGCLEMLRGKVAAGVTTNQLDALAESYIREHGGIPAFKGFHGYPATLCTSVNDECVHGIPNDEVLQNGDIVSLDCGVIYDELYTDACITVGVGNISKEAQNLLHVTENALADAVSFLKAGVRVGDVSALIQASVEKGGCRAVKSLTGHGLGKTLHQYPDIPNLGKKGTGPVFPAGTVVAIEPIVSISADEVHGTGDGWTLVTEDGSLAAHFEHTILILENGCEVLA